MAFGQKKEEVKINDVVQNGDEVVAQTNPQLDTPAVATNTDALKAKKNAASKKMIEKKKAAIKVLSDLALRLGDAAEKTAAAYLTGEGRVAGVRTAGPAVSILTTLFADTPGTAISEGEVFKMTKMGRSEMRAQIKKLVQNDNYIVFDAVAETYTFVGKEKPANWTGPNKAAPKL